MVPVPTIQIASSAAAAAATPAARPHAYLVPVPPGDSAPPAVAAPLTDYP